MNFFLFQELHLNIPVQRGNKGGHLFNVHLRKKIVCQEKHKVSTVFTYSTGTYCIIGVQVV